jgi:hypothetical protein
MVIMMFLLDKLLIEQSTLKFCFQEQGSPSMKPDLGGRVSNNQLKGQFFCFLSVFQSKLLLLQCIQIYVKPQ